MTQQEIGERVAKNEEAISNICDTLKELKDSYSEFKEKMFERFDDLKDKIGNIKTKLDTEEKIQLRVVNIRMWLIGLIVSGGFFVISLLLRR